MHRKLAFFVALACLALLGRGLPAAAGPQPLRVAVATPARGAQGVVAGHFAALLEKEAPGHWRVEVIHAAQDGNESRILEQLRAGDVEVAVLTTAVYDRYCPAVRVVEHPFLFCDHSQVDRVLGGKPGRAVLEALAPAGLAGLGFSENGFRQLTNNLRPVETPADLAGITLRTMESLVPTKLWSLLGATPVPHPWPINQLLASGGADGQENPLWILEVYQLYKLQKHLSLTSHVYSSHIGAANLRWFNSLKPREQAVLRLAFQEAAEEQKKAQRARNASVLELVRAQGMRVVERPDREAFRTRAAAIDELPFYREPAVAELLARFRKDLGN